MDGNMVLCCTLCGVWIKQGRRPCLDWLSRARAARSYRVVSSPFLTGVGFLREYDSCLLAPADPSCDMDELDIGHAELHDPFLNRGDEGRCFIFHDKCWFLLASKVKLEIKHAYVTNSCSKYCIEKAIARLLFYFLNTMEMHEKEYLRLRHDYGGASTFFRPHNPRNFPILHRPTEDVVTSIPRELAYLFADPFSMDGVFNGPSRETIEWENSALNPKAVPQWKWWPAGGKPTNSDLFSKLPDDVIHQIMTFLPSEDILTTCRASVAVSKVSTRDQLPQSFWASRFAPGAEMDFIAPIVCHIAPDGQPDWRQIYFDAERAVQNTGYLDFIGIKNRKRIWKVLSYFTDSIIPMLRRYPHGEIPWLKPRSSHLPMEYTVGPRAGPSRAWTQPTTATAGWNPERSLSGQLLGSQSVLWPCDPVTEPLRLGVSRIKFDGRWFICGLRVWPAYGSSHSMTKMTAGLIDDYEEQDVIFQKGDKLLGLKVLYSSSAIIGLGFKICLGRDGKTRDFAVNWDIDDARCYSTVEQEWLEPTKPGHTIVGFNIGLDPFRIESIGLILKPYRQEIRSLTPRYTDGANECHLRTSSQSQ